MRDGRSDSADRPEAQEAGCARAGEAAPPRPLVLYHASCADGFCAAWCAHGYFGERADYVPVQYGQEPPDVTGRPVILLDFSYRRSVLLDMAERAESVLVLDHHKTAAADLVGGYEMPYPCTGMQYRLLAPMLIVCVEQNKSGGRLAWDHFCGHESPAWLVDYTEDRDLWRWKLPYSREINAGLAARPRDFRTWDWLAASPSNKDLMRADGEAILRYQAQLVAAHVQNAKEISFHGHKVLAVNATCLMSEIGEALAEGRPFGATYFDRADGKRQWSLRSREGGLDVSEVAKAHGGGGHRNAAGFEERSP